eukprot:TRINITY_DN2855_c0_g1_i1.p1 TRINITY_DN2855_c0_g1~~TRINITY_DN2855_c0_g1_i1.p1  ORF type:complete len:550 (+),score=129.85 TRINITY_DN2855_c0_g1_i1:41-1651(+)
MTTAAHPGQVPVANGGFAQCVTGQPAQYIHVGQPLGYHRADPLAADPLAGGMGGMGGYMAPMFEAAEDSMQTVTSSSTPTATEGYTTPHSNTSMTRVGGAISPTAMHPNPSPTPMMANGIPTGHFRGATPATPVVVAQLREEFYGEGGVVSRQCSPNPGAKSPPPAWRPHQVPQQWSGPPQSVTPTQQQPYDESEPPQQQQAQQHPHMHPLMNPHQTLVAPASSAQPYFPQQYIQPLQPVVQGVPQMQIMSPNMPQVVPQLPQVVPQMVVPQQQTPAASQPAAATGGESKKNGQGQPCKVVLLKNVPWTVDLAMLTQVLDQYVSQSGAKVCKLLPVWDTGMVFAELTATINLSCHKLQLQDNWVDLEVARNGKVNVAPVSNILQVRFITLTPGRDISTTATANRAAHQKVVGLGNVRLTAEGAKVLATQLGTSWEAAILPPASVRSTKQTIPHLRRKYAQLLLKYGSTEEATSIRDAYDGRVVSIHGISMVVRLEYAKQTNSTPTGRLCVSPNNTKIQAAANIEDMFTEDDAPPRR